ncbi:MAG: septum formation protein Maf [Fluviicola sp.]|nr:septum formation protein Maf [Fluviicola sp.]MBP6271043.1 septum formation protein Maf [Fluviicola sp.]
MKKKIILGSGSPRRKELLAALGYNFEVRTKDTDESYPTAMSCEEVPAFLAKQKAAALLSELNEDELLICADTVVILDNQILGKPANNDEASEMLNFLSGKTHKVITGVFIGDSKQEVIFSDTTEVTFNTLSENQINYYIENYQPFDKAGSYGIQEWIGFIGVASITGTYANVMGLPTHEIFAVLSKKFKLLPVN